MLLKKGKTFEYLRESSNGWSICLAFERSWFNVQSHKTQPGPEATCPTLLVPEFLQLITGPEHHSASPPHIIRQSSSCQEKNKRFGRMEQISCPYILSHTSNPCLHTSYGKNSSTQHSDMTEKNPLTK